MICPGCGLPSHWSHGFGMRWCGMCGYLERNDMKKVGDMRANCLKCQAMTMHVRNDAGNIVCSICGRVLVELW